MSFSQRVFLATKVMLQQLAFLSAESSWTNEVDVFLRILQNKIRTQGEGGVAKGWNCELGASFGNVSKKMVIITAYQE
jgi:hypothetical protein